MKPYIIWDWNGTLFDDRALLFIAVVEALSEEGIADVTPEQVAGNFTRPLRALLEKASGRTLTDTELTRLESAFHRSYRRNLAAGALVPDALDALVYAQENARGQSLISNWPHNELTEIIRQHAVPDVFDDIQGRPDASSKTKADLLDELHAHKHLDPRMSVLIGDSVDDVHAATTAGCKIIVVRGASLERDPLRGAVHSTPAITTTDTLTEAVARACEMRHD